MMCWICDVFAQKFNHAHCARVFPLYIFTILTSETRLLIVLSCWHKDGLIIYWLLGLIANYQAVFLSYTIWNKPSPKLFQGALNTPAPISYFEPGQIDYLKQVILLRKYIENLPDSLKCELREFIPPLCVFLYHELRQRQSKEVYISFLAKVVELKILPSANEVDNQEYFNTKHVVSLSRNTHEHLMDLITQQEWLSILSVINQKFVFDIKKESNPKAAESKSRTALQKACSNLELGLGPSSFSFVKTIKVTNKNTILCMTLTPDNKTLLASSSDSTIYKWSLTSSPPSQISQSSSKTTPKTPLPLPETTLIYQEQFTVDQGESDRLYTELRGHSGPVYWVCVKGGYALSASHDGSVALWHLQSERKFC